MRDEARLKEIEMRIQASMTQAVGRTAPHRYGIISEVDFKYIFDVLMLSRMSSEVPH